MNIILRRRGFGLLSTRRIADGMGNEVTVVRSDRKKGPYGDVIRWGCTASVNCEGRVYNDSEAISLAANKSNFRKFVNNEGICPKTWFNVLELPADGQYQYIVRPEYHFKGRQLYLARDAYEANEAAYLCGDNYYISEYIDKEYEYRVFVVQGRGVFVIKKNALGLDRIGWNHHGPGDWVNVRWSEWNLDAVRKSIRACELAGLDFGAVDVVVDKEGVAYVLEVNTAPLVNSNYWGYCVSKAFDYMLGTQGDNIPITNRGWKGVIHPAICDRASIGD